MSRTDIARIAFREEKPIPVVYKGSKLDCGYRADVIVCGRIVIEVKAIANIAPIHEAVMLTYLRLSGCKIGLIINFHSVVLKDGIRRYVWKYDEPSLGTPEEC